MELYPAIDLYEGRVVRLTKGDFAQKKIYSADPAAFAKKWADAGARWIHVVDLEGAKTGIQKNLTSVLKIRETVPCKIQFGGGLRTLETIDLILSHGIDRAIVGTKAMDRKFLEQAAKRFGSQLAVGLDVRDGIVQTQGWLDGQNPTLAEALKFLNDASIEMIIYTDIQKDGMMAGPNFEGLASVLNAVKSKVILSGGVSSMSDLKICSQMKSKNFEGPIIGKALYEGAINLSEALRLAQE